MAEAPENLEIAARAGQRCLREAPDDGGMFRAIVDEEAIKAGLTEPSEFLAVLQMARSFVEGAAYASRTYAQGLRVANRELFGLGGGAHG